MRVKPRQNIVGKGENDGETADLYFVLFSQYSPPFQGWIPVFLSHMEFVKNVFNLDKPKLLSFCEKLQW